MTALFEQHRTDWSLTITEDEIARVNRVLLCMARAASGESIVWLTKASATRRLWIVRDGDTLIWVSCDAAPTDPDFALPLPEHFVEEMATLAQISSEVTLFCDEKRDAIVCKGDDRYVAVDHPRDAEFTPSDLPYIGQSGPGGHHALALLDEADMETFARTCTNVPTRLNIDFYPHVQARIGDGQMRWTMDWRRFGLWRITKAVPARTEGEAVCSFFPWSACRALMMVGTSGDTKIFVAGPDADHVYFVADDWGVRTANCPEEMVRWHRHVVDALESHGCQVVPRNAEWVPSAVAFADPGGHTCAASVHRSDDGTTDSVRLTHVVADGVHDSDVVMARLNTINSTVVGARIVLREGEVRITVEFPAADLANIAGHVQCLENAIAACGAGGSFLPLFPD